MGTSKSLYATVYFYMFIEIGSLSETEGASFMRAHIRSLICVDPQVVEEIVPFPEAFAAVFVITFEYLDIPL